MKLASIDIGSNSVLLLIAEYDYKSKKLKTILNEYKISRLAENLEETGKISEKRIKLLTEIMKEYSAKIEYNKCSEILITGSFALRKAENRNVISELTKEISNVELKILSKKEEAYYSFLGAATSCEKEGRVTVIDIGGGSTEIAIGERRNLLDYKSFEVGVVTLYDRFSKSFPFDDYRLNKISAFIQNKIFPEQIKFIDKVKNVIAVAGTPTSLAAIQVGMREHYNENEIEGMQIEYQQILDFIAIGKNTPGNKLIELYGSILRGREDLLIYGSLILKFIIEQVNISYLTVSGRGVRYGAIIKHLNDLGYIVSEIK